MPTCPRSDGERAGQGRGSGLYGDLEVTYESWTIDEVHPPASDVLIQPQAFPDCARYLGNRVERVFAAAGLDWRP